MNRFLHPHSTLIVADGEKPSAQLLHKLCLNAKNVIALDGAVSWLRQNGITPTMVIGDMDSAPTDHLNGVETLKISNQDTNDLEKAFQYCVAEELGETSVIGCFGLRADHFLTNLYVMGRYSDRLSINMFDDHQCAFFCPKDQTITIDDSLGRYLSLFPLGNEVGPITARGLKFPLDKELLCLSSRIGTLNSIVSAKATISCQTANLLILMQRP